MSIPAELQWVISLVVGAICTYFGAMNAIKENLARLDEGLKAAKEDAAAAQRAADKAHDRLDRMLMK